MSDKMNKARRWILLGGAAVLAVGFAVREYQLTPPPYDGGQIGVVDAHQQAVSGEILLLDIRTPREWKATGVAEGAAPLDMRREDFVDVLDELADGDRTAAIALICARGVRSARLSNRLSAAGFSNIIDVPEGMLGSAAGPGWLRAGLPVGVYGEEIL